MKPFFEHNETKPLKHYNVSGPDLMKERRFPSEQRFRQRTTLAQYQSGGRSSRPPLALVAFSPLRARGGVCVIEGRRFTRDGGGDKPHRETNFRQAETAFGFPA